MSDDDTDGFDNYVETTVDPGIWLLLITCVFCFGIMLVIVPLLVSFALKRRRKIHESSSTDESLVKGGREPVEVTFWSVVCCNKETLKILKLAIPYTISALASSSLSNICLILVSKHIGTKAVTAYALVQILAGLSDGVLQGPIYACTTLCAHAVGAGNCFLAGQYIQLAIIMYLLFNIPVVYFWWNYMYDIILYLEWGDKATAALAQEFIRVYIWSYLLGGISSSVWQLLEVADHTIAGTLMSIAWGVTNVVIIGYLVLATSGATLNQVGYAYIGTAIFFIGLTLLIAHCRGWFAPFSKGLFGSMAICNLSATARLLGQGIPLAFGSLLSNAEWAILTVRFSA
jgi:Na+-driven multidrug efflux pump